jgi:hypothetical protein
MSDSRTKKQRRPTFTARQVIVEAEHLEGGLELVARLLLERWEARHTKEKSDVEEGD